MLIAGLKPDREVVQAGDHAARIALAHGRDEETVHHRVLQKQP
jgi:hypothetical protein